MADESNAVAKYEAVYLPSADFLCGLCKDLVHQPQVTLCCQKQSCKPCLQSYMVSGQPCPFCGNKLEAIPNTEIEKELTSVLVKCCNVKQGCMWEGCLEKLQEHLDYHCPSTIISCSQGCGVKVERSKLDDHKATSCINKKQLCDNCTIESRTGKINDHLEKCTKVNKEGVQTSDPSPGEHECHQLACPYSIAGCSELLSPDQIAKHLLLSSHKHIWLKNMFENYVQQIQSQLCQSETEVEEKSLELKQVKAQLQLVNENQNKLKNELKHEKKISEALEKRLSNKTQELQSISEQLKTAQTMYLPVFPSFTVQATPTDLDSNHVFQENKPVSFILTSFSKFYEPDPEKKGKWTSNHFFTSENGYKMCFEVDCPIDSIRVCLYILPGPNDDTLAWPLRGSITLVILNQAADTDHWMYSFIYDNTTAPDVANQVHPNRQCSEGCVSESQQLPLSLLSPSSSQSSGNRTASDRLYVANDTLLFELTKADLDIKNTD